MRTRYVAHPKGCSCSYCLQGKSHLATSLLDVTHRSRLIFASRVDIPIINYQEQQQNKQQNPVYRRHNCIILRVRQYSISSRGEGKMNNTQIQYWTILTFSRVYEVPRTCVLRNIQWNGIETNQYIYRTVQLLKLCKVFKHTGNS